MKLTRRQFLVLSATTIAGVLSTTPRVAAQSVPIFDSANQVRGSLRGFKRALQKTTVDELNCLNSSQKIALLQGLVSNAIKTSLGGLETSGECINFVLEDLRQVENV